jgi:thiamine transport system substrate-binding protein
VCLNYDKAYFGTHELPPPTSLEALTKPEYKDLTVVENPATSSPGLAFLLGTIDHFGEEGWLGYWKQLEANGVEVASSGRGVLHRLLGQLGQGAEADRGLVRVEPAG